MSDVDQSGVASHHLVHAASGSAQEWAGADASACLHDPHLAVLGLLTPPACPEARQFLQHLVTAMRADGQLAGSSSDGHYRSAPAQCLGTALWHALAELNTLLAQHFSGLPTSMLRGYHSFVKAPRAQLWARFAASQGAQGHEAAFGRDGGPSHAMLLRFLLEHVLEAYPSASAVVYTIEVPHWLRGWCARWGHPGHGPIRVMALFAYRDNGALPPSSPRVLYIPCAE
ncbi:hypothetical protein GPECTOR_2g1050 [Gonium pectorale]|uniref:Uncharacterized protein n=1 Tax=Gonium pectorale TaxID=33097 RepID=A0A150H086_GONPE|nr:hypothetical protein GPECTOR_2g1050 [Gonium pectorale]|eukprot:KXZ55501.1 hypothetical protein GPECTOR_2g1050 [Gonium pectorale]